ncbi:Anthranilate synthase component 1 1 protein [Halorhabdus tiamatea SARL4B]|uniref:Anthranilate synthase component 1 n=1 Tax=Halorhabdus tiamatea SARL4B TaxID=1033806 RepID=F7PQI7_9EURY|nr:anthranilate synthase component I [Halorhabdus tiamatea]ERJ04874.1 Anthranilate synthase component 1 1 protein [Halorhabdus tiamatea SARL4B]CCQ33315.1 anthranilate synthase component I [Halorhabdus tiamatea SARL4B]
MTGEPSLSREEFVAFADADEPGVIRVAVELDADVDPLAAYAAVTGREGDAGTVDSDAGEYAFLLESAEKVASSDPNGAFAPTTDDRHARYSFVGYDPVAVATVEPDGTDLDILDDRYGALLETNGGDVLDDLRAVLPDVERRGFPEHDRQTLSGGLVGFLAYEAVYDLWLDEVGVDRPDSRFPDAQFVLATKTLVFDHAEGTVSLVFTPVVRPIEDADARYDELLDEAARVETALAAAGEPETGGFDRVREDAGPQDDYEDAVERAKDHVLDGDIYQGVISRKRELYGDVDPLALYDSLRSINPSPYMYLLGYDDRTIVGASPETLVSVGGDLITSNPIAGTSTRGNSPVEDRRLAGEMLADEKERAEHTMLVDLARNDVRRVGEPGSVRVEEFMNVLKYSHVQHIESTVTGTLAESADAFDATRAAFPAGTLSGAPKIRAMEIIDDLEPDPRGIYGGGVGYFSWNGDADFAIVIRSAAIEHGIDAVDGSGEKRTQDRITVQAGAGIVADSDPASEYEETEQKMGGVIDALERIESEPNVEVDTEAPIEEVSR